MYTKRLLFVSVQHKQNVFLSFSCFSLLEVSIDNCAFLHNFQLRSSIQNVYGKIEHGKYV